MSSVDLMCLCCDCCACDGCSLGAVCPCVFCICDRDTSLAVCERLCVQVVMCVRGDVLSVFGFACVVRHLYCAFFCVVFCVCWV